MLHRICLTIIALIILSNDVYGQEFDQLMDEVWEKFDSSPAQCFELLDQAMTLTGGDIQRQLEVKETRGILFDELGFGNKSIELYLEVLKKREQLGDNQALISFVFFLESSPTAVY